MSDKGREKTAGWKVKREANSVLELVYRLISKPDTAGYGAEVNGVPPRLCTGACEKRKGCGVRGAGGGAFISFSSISTSTSLRPPSLAQRHAGRKRLCRSEQPP